MMCTVQYIVLNTNRSDYYETGCRNLGYSDKHAIQFTAEQQLFSVD